eukprot:m.346654 g.346654  ORF g.346654 m.346654 type:complete len:1044 (-) comp29752_c0_seq1:85-3216(-)
MPYSKYKRAKKSNSTTNVVAKPSDGMSSKFFKVYLIDDTYRMIQTTEEDNAEAIRDRIVEKHDLGSNSADFVLIQYLKNGDIHVISQKDSLSNILQKPSIRNLLISRQSLDNGEVPPHPSKKRGKRNKRTKKEKPDIKKRQSTVEIIESKADIMEAFKNTSQTSLEKRLLADLFELDEATKTDDSPRNSSIGLDFSTGADPGIWVNEDGVGFTSLEPMDSKKFMKVSIPKNQPKSPRRVSHHPFDQSHSMDQKSSDFEPINIAQEVKAQIDENNCKVLEITGDDIPVLHSTPAKIGTETLVPNDDVGDDEVYQKALPHTSTSPPVPPRHSHVMTSPDVGIYEEPACVLETVDKMNENSEQTMDGTNLLMEYNATDLGYSKTLSDTMKSGLMRCDSDPVRPELSPSPTPNVKDTLDETVEDQEHETEIYQKAVYEGASDTTTEPLDNEHYYNKIDTIRSDVYDSADKDDADTVVENDLDIDQVDDENLEVTKSTPQDDEPPAFIPPPPPMPIMALPGNLSHPILAAPDFVSPISNSNAQNLKEISKPENDEEEKRVSTQPRSNDASQNISDILIQLPKGVKRPSEIWDMEKLQKLLGGPKKNNESKKKENPSETPTDKAPISQKAKIKEEYKSSSPARQKNESNDEKKAVLKLKKNSKLNLFLKKVTQSSSRVKLMNIPVSTEANTSPAGPIDSTKAAITVPSSPPPITESTSSVPQLASSVAEMARKFNVGKSQGTSPTKKMKPVPQESKPIQSSNLVPPPPSTTVPPPPPMPSTSIVPPPQSVSSVTRAQNTNHTPVQDVKGALLAQIRAPGKALKSVSADKQSRSARSSDGGSPSANLLSEIRNAGQGCLKSTSRRSSVVQGKDNQSMKEDKTDEASNPHEELINAIKRRGKARTNASLKTEESQKEECQKEDVKATPVLKEVSSIPNSPKQPIFVNKSNWKRKDSNKQPKQEVEASLETLDIDILAAERLNDEQKNYPTWKKNIVLKKVRKTLETELEEKKQKKLEDNKWVGVPGWKRALLERRAQDGPGTPRINNTSSH